MSELTDLSEGDLLKHNESGAIREVSGFIKNFSGEREKAKLQPRRDLTHKFDVPGDVPGHSRVASEGLSNWEIVEGEN